MASFQSTVNFRFTGGVPGEKATDAPSRTTPWRLSAQTAQPNYFGYGYTYSADSAVTNGSQGAHVAAIGGTGAFAGILVNPKAHVLYGANGDPLAPALFLPAGSEAELATKGDYFVNFSTAVTYGDAVYFDQTTGALFNATGAGRTLIPNAIVQMTTGAAGVSIVSLNQ